MRREVTNALVMLAAVAGVVLLYTFVLTRGRLP